MSEVQEKLLPGGGTRSVASAHDARCSGASTGASLCAPTSQRPTCHSCESRNPGALVGNVFCNMGLMNQAPTWVFVRTRPRGVQRAGGPLRYYSFPLFRRSVSGGPKGDQGGLACRMRGWWAQPTLQTGTIPGASLCAPTSLQWCVLRIGRAEGRRPSAYYSLPLSQRGTKGDWLKDEGVVGFTYQKE